MGLERLALFARDDMDVEVEHGLAGGGAVELLDQHAFGAHRLLDLRRELLHHRHQSGERVRLDVEQIARLLLGDDQCVAFRARHDVEEGERVLVLVDLVAGDLAAQDLGEDVIRIVGHANRIPEFFKNQNSSCPALCRASTN